MRTDAPVVIAIDGSAHSAQTLRWGLTEAGLRGADVLLARAYQEPHEFAEWSWYTHLGEDLGFDAKAKQYLADQLERERARDPALTIDTRLLHGPAVPELRQLSEEAQLLVVGASGRTDRVRIGSVSRHLAAHARCPVAVVRSESSEHPGTPVVVGVDGSPPSLAAARTAAHEAALRGVALVLVHARPTIVGPYGRGMSAMIFPADAAFDANDSVHRAALEVAQTLRDAHPDLDVRLQLVDDDPVHALVAAAREAQLVVVGSRGLGAFRGMLLGAVSSEVVRDATSTVLVMHDGEAD